MALLACLGWNDFKNKKFGKQVEIIYKCPVYIFLAFVNGNTSECYTFELFYLAVHKVERTYSKSENYFG